MHKVVPVMILLALASCSQGRKLQSISGGCSGPVISITQDVPQGRSVKVEGGRISSGTAAAEQGECVMNAVMGDDGEMVATDVLDAAVTVSTFRNVAERKGFVDLKFDITAPSSIIDGMWQLRFTPVMKTGDDTLMLDPVYITGEKYRRAQLAGYSKYRKYVDGIITDPDAFVDHRELGIYLQRHPDTSSAVVDHYTDKVRRDFNNWKAGRMDEMFSRYVRNPIRVSGLRLDTVVVSCDSSVRFDYVQTIASRPDLKKAELLLLGELHCLDGRVVILREAGPLTFYISSLSTLAKEPEDKSDTLYMNGFSALKEHRFRDAISRLARYGDFNAALAYCALDYNERAMEILLRCSPSAAVDYVKAIIYSRSGEDMTARDHYLAACSEDGSFVHRGNLDPEISRLKNKYDIN